MAVFSLEALTLLACPKCRQALEAFPTPATAVSLRCTGCGNLYPILDGIPILLIDRATTEALAAT